MIFFTLKNGALGAAQSYIITALTMMPVFYIVTFKYINLKFLDFLTMVWRPMVSVFAMHYCVFYALIWLQDGSKIENPILLLLIAIFVGVFSYSIVLLVLWVLSSKPEGAESFLLEKTKNFLRTKIGNRT
jgi:hypothetical protein